MFAKQIERAKDALSESTAGIANVLKTFLYVITGLLTAILFAIVRKS